MARFQISAYRLLLAQLRSDGLTLSVCQRCPLSGGVGRVSELVLVRYVVSVALITC